MKAIACVLSQPAGHGNVESARQVWVDPGHRPTIELPLLLRSVVLANEADVHIRTGQDPRIVSAGEEDGASLLDPLKDSTTAPATDALRGEEASTLGRAISNRGPRLLVPISAEIGHAWDSIAEDREKGSPRSRCRGHVGGASPQGTAGSRR